MTHKIITAVLSAAIIVVSSCRSSIKINNEETRAHFFPEENGEGSMEPIKLGYKYQTPPLQQIPPCSSIVTGTLNNGLTYYIYKTNENQGFNNVAEIMLMQKTGSLVEDDEQIGVAHFVEHCASTNKGFNSLEYFKGKGGFPNATTAFNFTEYHSGFILSSAIDSSMYVMRHIASNCNFYNEDLERERKIILEEYRMRNYSAMFDIINNIHQGTRYAKRPVLGTIESINAITVDDLRNYYNKWYQPQNQAILVFGDIDIKQTEDKIKEVFSNLKRGTTDIPTYKYTHTPHTEPIFATVENNWESIGRLELYFNIPDQNLALNRNTVAWSIQNHLQDRIAKTINNRLENIKNESELFEYVDCSNNSGFSVTDNTQMKVSVGFVPQNWRNAVEAVVAEIEKIKQYGWTKKEIYSLFSGYNDTLQPLTDSVDFSVSTRWGDNNCGADISYINNFAYGEPIFDNNNHGPLSMYQSKHLNPGVYHDYYTKIVTDSNMVVILGLPQGINSNEVRNVYMQARNANYENTKYRYAEQPNYKSFIDNLDVNPAPGKTVKVRKIDFEKCTELTFKNGVKAVVCDKNSGQYDIHIKGIRQGALTHYNNDDAKKIKLLSDVIATPMFAIKHISKNTMFNFDHYYDTYECDARLSSFTIEKWLKYLHYCLTTTDIDTLRFNGIIQKYIANANSENSLLSQFDNLFDNAIHDENYADLFAPLSEEALNKLTISELKNLYQSYISNYNGTVFLIQSDYNVKQLKPLLEKYLGSLPSKPTPVTPTDNKAFHFKTVSDTSVYHYQADEARSDIQLSYTLFNGYHYSQKRLIIQKAFENILYNLLFNHIRVADGSAYSFYTSIYTTRKPTEGQVLYAYTVCKPENARIILNKMDSIIHQMAYGDLITEQQVKTFTDNFLNSFNTTILQRNYINHLTNLYLNDGIDMRITDPALIRSLTAADLRNFAKEMIEQGVKHELIVTGE